MSPEDKIQYEAGRKRAENVNTQYKWDPANFERELWFAATSNRPSTKIESSWLVRGYWDTAAELLSNTPPHSI